jgi:hypothetical protein
MKNYDYWKSFVNTGRIDDYLHYIACTREDVADHTVQAVDQSMLGMEKDKEGGVVAGINYRDRNGSVSHAGW